MAYRLKYSDYPGTAEGPPDPERWVGPPGPMGPPGPQGIPGPLPPGAPFLPLSGGAVTGNTTIRYDTTGNNAIIFTPNSTENVGSITGAQMNSQMIAHASGGTPGSVYANAQFGSSITGAPNMYIWSVLSIADYSGSGGNGQHVANYMQAIRRTQHAGGTVNNPEMFCSVMECVDYTNTDSALTNTMNGLEIDMTCGNTDSAKNRRGLGMYLNKANTSDVTPTVNLGIHVAAIAGYYNAMFRAEGAFQEAAIDLRVATEATSAAHSVWLKTGNDIALDTAGMMTLNSDGNRIISAAPFTVSPATLTTTTFNSAHSIQSTAQGSGTNGPATAQIGLNINHSKPNYLTTSSVGELDGLYVTVRQGGPGSDAGGVLVDVATAGTGFSAILEGVSTQMAPTTGTTQRAIRAQMGTINPSASTYQGLLLQAQNGTSSTGLMINDVAGQGSWTNFIEGWLSGTQNFIVANSGGVYAAGGLTTGTAGQVRVQGNVAVSGGGSYLAYNRAGDGTTYLLTNRGAGSSGGFQFADVSNTNVLTVYLAIFSSGIYFQPVPVFFDNTALLHMPSGLINAANDAAASVAGVPVGVMYRNGSALMVRVV